LPLDDGAVSLDITDFCELVYLHGDGINLLKDYGTFCNIPAIEAEDGGEYLSIDVEGLTAALINNNGFNGLDGQIKFTFMDKDKKPAAYKIFHFVKL
jgi:hypothetical protein